MLRAMRRLMEDDALRRRLAEQGAEWVLANYSIEAAMPNLIRVAEIALHSETREELRATLEADPSLTSSVSTFQIEQLLSNMWGTLSLCDRVVMTLIHNPVVFRNWLRVMAILE